MSPDLQNLLLKSPAAQQAELDAMPPEQRAVIEDELADYYRHCLPDFDAFHWILRVPKHRFQRLCPSLQDSALRYATPEELKFVRGRKKEEKRRKKGSNVEFKCFVIDQIAHAAGVAHVQGANGIES